MLPFRKDDCTWEESKNHKLLTSIGFTTKVSSLGSTNCWSFCGFFLLVLPLFSHRSLGYLIGCYFFTNRGKTRISKQIQRDKIISNSQGENSGRRIIFTTCSFFSGLKVVPQSVTPTTSLPVFIWGTHLVGTFLFLSLKPHIEGWIVLPDLRHLFWRLTFFCSWTAAGFMTLLINIITLLAVVQFFYLKDFKEWQRKPERKMFWLPRWKWIKNEVIE